MIKLTKHHPNGGEVGMEIRIEGRLDADAVPELHDLVASCPAPRTVSVDLSGLVSMDQAGRSLLIALRESGCRLYGGSLYVNHLLKEVQPWPR